MARQAVIMFLCLARSVESGEIAGKLPPPDYEFAIPVGEDDLAWGIHCRSIVMEGDCERVLVHYTAGKPPSLRAIVYRRNSKQLSHPVHVRSRIGFRSLSNAGVFLESGKSFVSLDDGKWVELTEKPGSKEYRSVTRSGITSLNRLIECLVGVWPTCDSNRLIALARMDYDGPVRIVELLREKDEVKSKSIAEVNDNGMISACCCDRKGKLCAVALSGNGSGGDSGTSRIEI